jgi:NAD(P)-dependent dehydrogenase (short-subunit alcohol dehydrogenase family)
MEQDCHQIAPACTKCRRSSATSFTISITSAIRPFEWRFFELALRGRSGRNPGQRSTRNRAVSALTFLHTKAMVASLLPLGQITEEHFDDTFARNVKGTLFTVQTALPLLGKGSSVILTGSTAASGGTEAFSVYAASKAAVRAFARNWILDLKGRDIRVNTLSPGPIKTPGLVELVGTDATQQEGFLDHLASLIPMGRVGDPDEIAKAAVFLASEDSSFVNGIELFVDGGIRQI